MGKESRPAILISPLSIFRLTAPCLRVVAVHGPATHEMTHLSLLHPRVVRIRHPGGYRVTCLVLASHHAPLEPRLEILQLALDHRLRRLDPPLAVGDATLMALEPRRRTVLHHRVHRALATAVRGALVTLPVRAVRFRARVERCTTMRAHEHNWRRQTSSWRTIHLSNTTNLNFRDCTPKSTDGRAQ